MMVQRDQHPAVVYHSLKTKPRRLSPQNGDIKNAEFFAADKRVSRSYIGLDCSF
jgi:hypothetical protein